MHTRKLRLAARVRVPKPKPWQHRSRSRPTYLSSCFLRPPSFIDRSRDKTQTASPLSSTLQKHYKQPQSAVRITSLPYDLCQIRLERPLSPSFSTLRCSTANTFARARMRTRGNFTMINKYGVNRVDLYLSLAENRRRLPALSQQSLRGRHAAPQEVERPDLKTKHPSNNKTKKRRENRQTGRPQGGGMRSDQCRASRR